MAKVLGVGGVFFKSKKPKELSSWYAEHLGLIIDTSTNSFSFEPESMPVGSCTVLGLFDSDTTYFNPSERDYMFNLIVDDLDEAVSQVRNGGAEIIGEIERYSYGRFAWFLDPEGNKVELWEPCEAEEEQSIQS